MIPFISKYFYELHNNKIYWLTKAERRKAWLMACGILICITIALILWLK
jgi:hypothetical protein